MDVGHLPQGTFWIVAMDTAFDGVSVAIADDDMPALFSSEQEARAAIAEDADLFDASHLFPLHVAVDAAGDVREVSSGHRVHNPYVHGERV